MLILEIVVVLALFVLNDFFAMAELAIVSSRRAHLDRLAKVGRAGAHIALALADDPARMLAAVQTGFTTTATLAGIFFSGATLAERLEEALQRRSFLGSLLQAGLHCRRHDWRDLHRARRRGARLAPKYIALNNPEQIAIRVAQPLAFVARVAAPVTRSKCCQPTGASRYFSRLVTYLL